MKTPIAIGFCFATLLASSTFGQSLESAATWTSGSGFNSHVYRLYSASAGISWTNAEALAVAQGGHLASSTSVQENTFIYNALGIAANNDVWFLQTSSGNDLGPWLGGHQPRGSAEPGGGYQWSDGSPFAYTNWAPGEPNNVNGGTENRIHFIGQGGVRSLKWNDAPHVALHAGFVVELPHACQADTNSDGSVNVTDLLAIIGTWGGGFGTADVNGDGNVNVTDLLAVISAWGACP